MPPRKRRPRVLVVEDDRHVRGFIVDALAPGAEVIEAADAREAVGRLSSPDQRHFDLVIVDCVLPGLEESRVSGGIQLLKTIQRQWPWLKVIAITGVASDHLIIDAFRSGARDFLKKPFGLEDLNAAIGRVTARRQGQRPSPRRAEAEASINRAIAFIGGHYTEPLSLQHLAGMASMSGPHFCRMFRALVGVSLRDYVRSLRLARAQELLRTTQRSLTDIALEVGFYDLPHFDKAFRKRFGVSPTEFQRRKDAARVGERRPPDVPHAEVS
jgi:YesN/AraC family two-component response regulator